MSTVRKPNQPVEFAMETTGYYRFSLYAHLRQDNQTVRVINLLQSDALRIGRYTKTEVFQENIYALR